MTDEELTNPYAPPEAQARADAPVETDELASRGRRLGAFLLDALIGLLFFLLGALFIRERFFEYVRQFAESAPPPPLAEYFSTRELLYLSLGTAVATFINAYLLTTRGQSVGKLVLGIRIALHDDLSNAGFVRAFLIRYFLHFYLLYQLPYVGLLYFLIDSLFIYRHDRRTIHDLLAGTTVVNTR